MLLWWGTQIEHAGDALVVVEYSGDAVVVGHPVL